jgi:hypothetical protein
MTNKNGKYVPFGGEPAYNRQRQKAWNGLPQAHAALQ